MLTYQTSGSTGEPQSVALSETALTWSAAASSAWLGAPGRWVLALPTDRVGGALVIERAKLASAAGIPAPLVICGSAEQVHFSVPELIAALEIALGLSATASGERLGTVPVYISLVPTQLFAVFAAPALLMQRAVSLLRQCEKILVGGAAFSPNLRTLAAQHKLKVTATYGMTETAGGCVYDGLPLPGVRLRIVLPGTDNGEPDTYEVGQARPSGAELAYCDAPRKRVECGQIGLIELAGPMLAEGYLPEVTTGTAQPTSRFYQDASGVKWFRTSDLGYLDAHGNLTVVGRADQVIITGGVNVHPAAVEAATAAAWEQVMGDPTQVIAIGKPSEKWGQEITAIIEHCAIDDADNASFTSKQAARMLELVKENLGSVATPKQIFTLDKFPLLPGGKVDRIAIGELFED